MSGYFIKSPAAVLDVTFTWADQLDGAHETVATDLGWSIEPDEADAGGMTVSASSHADETTTVHLAGGITGAAYQVRNRVLTSEGRELERSLALRVANH